MDTVRTQMVAKDSINTNSSKGLNNNDAVAIINAVGGSWPFLLTVFLIVVVLTKWKTIWSKLDKTNKVKIAGQELEFNNESKEEKFESFEKTISPPEVSSEESEKIGNGDAPTLAKIFERLENSDFEAANKLFIELQKQTDEPLRQKNQIVFLWYQYLHGYSTALNDLLALEDVLSNDSKGYYYYILGMCYFRGENYENAITHFEKSLNLRFDVTTIRLTWESMYNLGRKQNAFDYLVSQISHARTDDIKSKIYFILSEHFDKEKNNLKKALALEKALELVPNNLTWLFSAGYSYSEVGLDLLALNHYLKRDYYDPEGTTSNNLGVAYSKLGLLSKSIEQYKKAFDLGETLAGSNLAYEYLENGFFNEAQEYISKAIQRPNVHRNVWSAKERLESQKKEENEKLDQIKIELIEQVRFLRKVGSKMFSITKNIQSNNIAPLKTDSGYLVEVKLNNETANMTWKDSSSVSHSIDCSLESDAGLATYKTSKVGSYGLTDFKNYNTGFYIFESGNWSFLFYGENTYVFLNLNTETLIQ